MWSKNMRQEKYTRHFYIKCKCVMTKEKFYLLRKVLPEVLSNKAGFGTQVNKGNRNHTWPVLPQSCRWQLNFPPDYAKHINWMCIPLPEKLTLLPVFGSSHLALWVTLKLPAKIQWGSKVTIAHLIQCRWHLALVRISGSQRLFLFLSRNYIAVSK